MSNLNSSDYKYVGMDIHLATSTCVVLDRDGKILSSTILQTKADLIRGFLNGLGGTVFLTFEECALAQWMFEITRSEVERVLVANPRKSSNKGVKNDKRDARKLAEMLRIGALRGVYHQARQAIAELKQLVAVYDQLTEDRTRVINRLRSVFHEQALSIELDDQKLAGYLEQLPTAGHRLRAELLISQLTTVTELRQTAHRKMLRQAGRDRNYKLLQSLPGVSEIRAAQLLAWVVTPHRFRTKRQFWSYCGLSVITRSSSDYRIENGGFVRYKKNEGTRGLTRDHHRRLKNLFKGAASDALRVKRVRPYYEGLVERGLKESIARVQLARKLAAGCLAIWKSGEEFAIERLVSG